MKKKLSGLMQSIIVGGAGIIIGMNILLPYFEKRNKEEHNDN